MIAFVLGEEKNPNPRPNTISPIIIYSNVVCALINAKIISPTVTKAIPKDARMRGS